MRTYQEAMAQAVAHMQRGMESRESREFYAAAELLDAVLEAWPHEPLPLIPLGMAAAELGKLGTSIALLAHATERMPQTPEAWHNLGTSLRRAGHVPRGRNALC